MSISLTSGKHIYIGAIREKNRYYNFIPLAVKQGDEWYILNTDDRRDLLPDSKHEDINFWYNHYNTDAENKIKKVFVENSLVIFEYDFDELEDNYNGIQRNDTGYKVNALDCIKDGSIRKLSSESIYRIITKDFYEGSFSPDKRIVVYEENFPEDSDDEFILMDDGDGFYAGPINVAQSSYDNRFCATPSLVSKNYIITGYSKADIKELKLSYASWKEDGNEWKIAICDNIKKRNKDYISENTLINEYLSALQSNLVDDNKIDISVLQNSLESEDAQMVNFLDVYDSDIKENRIRIIREYIDKTIDVEGVLDLGSKRISEIILANKDNDDIGNLLLNLTEDEDFLDKFQHARIVKDKIEDLKNQQSKLENENKDLLAAKEKLEASNSQLAEEARKEVTEEAKAELDSIVYQIESRKKELGSLEDYQKALKLRDDINRDVESKRRERDWINREIQSNEKEFEQFLRDKDSEMSRFAFQGFVSSKMLSAAAKWESMESEQNYTEAINAVNSINVTEYSSEELVDYVCDMVQKKRPTYKRNAIINLLICITQGFLTVFSGDPGSGKTSICNILGKILGAKDIQKTSGYKEKEIVLNRFLSISVERGWTSKRDLIGYYNPLSKTFDKSNKSLYNCLKILDIEKQKGIRKFPFFVLLDESNLSPMEYYWAEFMSICDGISEDSYINLGDDYILGIPDTLRFLCTINNDHTTETLSPRLIDRAWIIQLPKTTGYSREEDFEEDKLDIISWKLLQSTFGTRNDDVTFSSDIQTIYSKVLYYLKQLNIIVSPRVENAIRQYWNTASELFIADRNIDPSVIAIDYAMTQKTLPKICGSGENYRKCLTEFRSFCENSNLNMMAECLEQIIQKGDNQMKYYQFF